MQKITIDARLIFSSGIGVYLKENITRLAKFDVLITILITDKDLMEATQLFLDYNIKIISVPYPKYSIKSFFMLSGYINKCDVLWVPHITPFLMFGKKWKRTKVVYTIHDINTISFGIFKKVMYFCMAYLSCLFANKIVVVSDSTKKQIKRIFLGMFTNKVTIIYPGIPDRRICEKIDIIRPEIISHIDSEFILIVGNVKPHKNIEIVANIFSNHISELTTPLKLIVAGKIDDKYGFNLKKKYSSDSIVFLDKVTDAELDILYKNCRIFMFPSLFEGFGLPLLEAMLYDKKIICSNIPIFREISANKVTFFNEKSKTDIIEKINYVLNSNITVNYQSIIYQFDWNLSVEKLMKLFYNLHCSIQ